MSQEEQKVVVLVADDEPSTLALVASHVRSKGYKVLEASDGDLAWQLAHEHLPDLVVLDVMMPGMSGWEVCRKIREAVSLAHTGVIMLTGIGENLNEMTSPLYGADTYLDKPFEFAKLDECIRDVLARRKKEHAMGRPAETERPSSRPPANASKGNGMIVTSVAGLAERAAAQAEAREKASRSKRAGTPKKAKAETAKPLVKVHVKAKARPAASPAPSAKAAAKAKAATAPKSAAKGAKAKKASAKATTKPGAKAPFVLKPRTVAKAKPSAKALAKGKMAMKKSSPKVTAKAGKKGAKAVARAKTKTRTKKAAPATKAAKPAVAKSAKAASAKSPRAEPTKAAGKAKGRAKRAPSRTEGARA